mmetsp:Transcript_12560/g.56595  ORF Transcript_12560/g.56595 Transcript_12560/m.56595 type:complete len:266 (-) Transcript_12560:11-808(-)
MANLLLRGERPLAAGVSKAAPRHDRAGGGDDGDVRVPRADVHHAACVRRERHQPRLGLLVGGAFLCHSAERAFVVDPPRVHQPALAHGEGVHPAAAYLDHGRGVDARDGVEQSRSHELHEVLAHAELAGVTGAEHEALAGRALSVRDRERGLAHELAALRDVRVVSPQLLRVFEVRVHLHVEHPRRVLLHLPTQILQKRGVQVYPQFAQPHRALVRDGGGVRGERRGEERALIAASLAHRVVVSSSTSSVEGREDSVGALCCPNS